MKTIYMYLSYFNFSMLYTVAPFCRMKNSDRLCPLLAYVETYARVICCVQLGMLPVHYEIS